MGKDASELQNEIAQTRDRMSETVEAISYKADVPARVRDAVNDRVETVRGTIENAVGSVRDGVASLSDATGNVDMPASTKRAVSFAAGNPLGLALGAFAAGFLAGLVIPVSERRPAQNGVEPPRPETYSTSSDAPGARSAIPTR